MEREANNSERAGDPIIEVQEKLIFEECWWSKEANRRKASAKRIEI